MYLVTQLQNLLAPRHSSMLSTHIDATVISVHYFQHRSLSTKPRRGIEPNERKILANAALTTGVGAVGAVGAAVDVTRFLHVEHR